MPSSNRVAAIDILRALTVFLMVFVNDLWTLDGVPRWLEHASAGEDRLGLADIVFPGFLFIAGLSIPLAINLRLRKGDRRSAVLGHILLRSLALVVMGFYMVNWESMNGDTSWIGRPFWEILMVLAFALVWVDYKWLGLKSVAWRRGLMVLGIALLGFLALAYRGGTAAEPVWMRPHWWGILGLIGWAYLLNAGLYLAYRRMAWLSVGICLLLLLLNVREFAGIPGVPEFSIVVGASNHFCMAAGVMASVILIRFRERISLWRIAGIFMALCLLFLAFGILTRPQWGINKIMGTPSWTTISVGICLAGLAGLLVLSDVYGKVRWARPFMPAGTSTLTCYLVPYLVYPLVALAGLSLPGFFTTGLVGICKSLLFSLLIIQMTGLLEKARFRLRI